jgi:hypothetical protein
MPEYDNTNRFTLNKNTNKREGKRDADYTGSVNVNGVEYWLNGWITNSKNGPFISGSIRPKEQRQEQSISQRAMPKRYPDDRITSGRSLHDDDGEIPF